MNELTERLRTTGNWVVTKRVPFYPQENEEEFRTTPVCAEAADRIEELEAALREIIDMDDGLNGVQYSMVEAAAEALKEGES